MFCSLPRALSLDPTVMRYFLNDGPGKTQQQGNSPNYLRQVIPTNAKQIEEQDFDERRVCDALEVEVEYLVVVVVVV